MRAPTAPMEEQRRGGLYRPPSDRFAEDGKRSPGTLASRAWASRVAPEWAMCCASLEAPRRGCRRLPYGSQPEDRGHGFDHRWEVHPGPPVFPESVDRGACLPVLVGLSVLPVLPDLVTRRG